jgi:serine/threonine protein kinase
MSAPSNAPPEYAEPLASYPEKWWANETTPEEIVQTLGLSDSKPKELLQYLSALRSQLADEMARVTRAFGKAWQQTLQSATAGNRPRLEDWLGKVLKSNNSPAKRNRYFSELLIRELRYRDRAGEKPLSDEYRDRFPEPELLGRIARAFEQCGQAFTWRFRLVGGKPVRVGGQAEIWLGYDEQLDRDVLVKRVLSGASRDESEARLRREARTLARLGGLGVPDVYSVSYDEKQRLCLAEQLIQRDATDAPDAGDSPPGVTLGQPFGELLNAFHCRRAGDARRRNPVFLNLVAKLLEVARTVAAAHAHPFRILHRDLNPNNLIVDGRGRIYVIDWGLAVWLNEQAVRQRDTGELIKAGMTTITRGGGTPGYLSPEQTADRPLLTPASDVFGLGACLFQLLSRWRVYDFDKRWWHFGRPFLSPVGGAEQAKELIRRAESYRKVPHPRDGNPRTDAELCDICRRALDRIPSMRYASAGEFAEALEDWLNDAPPRHLTCSGSPLAWIRRRRYAFGRWVRRNTGWFVIALLLIFMVPVAGTVLWILQR